MTYLPEHLGQLTRLTRLNLDQFQIVNMLQRPKKIVLDLPDQTTNLVNLQYARAKGYVTRLDLLMGHNNSGQNLRTLILAHNKLTNIPEYISNLSNLTDLNINHNKITQLPTSLGQMRSLEVVTLRYNQLDTLPKELGQLIGLKSLEITQMKAMESIPQEIQNLSNLTQLIIRAGVARVPEISTLSHLRTLIFNDNKLVELPKFNNPELIRFEAENNQIQELTEDVGRLSKLEYLSLKNNSLLKISDSIAVMQALSYLDISNNQLIDLPNEICSLKNLKVLKADTNQLQSIPNNIGELILLELLWMSWNQLTELPESIGNLTNLKQLLASNNKITAIPVQISNCKNIITLDVRNNSVSVVPREFDQIRGKESAILVDKDVQSECKSISVRSTGYYDFDNKFDLYNNVLRN
jgi:Leucine-rich repeat (LRR) protein